MGRRLSTLGLNLPTTRVWIGIAKSCEVLVTLLFFSFVTLGFGEAQTGDCIWLCYRSLGK